VTLPSAKMGTNGAWPMPVILMLVTVWLACSHDSINGTDKSRDEVWAAICDNWLLKQEPKKGHSAC